MSTRGIRTLVAVMALLECRTDDVTASEWHIASANGFQVRYQETENQFVPFLLSSANEARSEITSFFRVTATAARPHRIQLHSSGQEYERYVRERWQQAGFVRACWMVGSADSSEIQLLSPNAWNRDACGHDPSDRQHLRDLVVHEAVHVYHRRYFAGTQFPLAPLAWFVEGLAVHASGALGDPERDMVRRTLAAGYVPATLAEVLTGPLGYNGVGSLVSYLDDRFGRQRLIELMNATSTADVLGRLGTEESDLIREWIASVR